MLGIACSSHLVTYKLTYTITHINHINNNTIACHRSMAPRRRPREGVAEQAIRPEVGDAPPPQQT
ncbi:hypothetical protein Taro_049550 [Colocasia esculenta]|uniref:Uncharacterized protein n=1 Tax=Colocasia esculenta TaxID=4460 RepID=A0A843XBE1_COLES|nr:hypothetical protein [Colocasia esculenta]